MRIACFRPSARLYVITRRSASSTARDDRGIHPATHLLSHLTAPSLDITISEAYEILSSQQQLVLDFASGMRKMGIEARYSDPELSILDHTCDAETQEGKLIVRCLHFNNNIDLVQSAIGLDSGGNPSIFTSIPIVYNKHVIGLSISLFLHQLNRKACKTNSLQKCAIVGGGGCTLPMFISKLYPNCSIDVIELSPSVASASLQWFGMGELDTSKDIRMHTACGLDWLKQDSQGFDMLCLDVCADSAVTLSDSAHMRIAPPDIFLQSSSIDLFVRCLRPGGILAINMLGSENSINDAISTLFGVLTKIGRSFHVSKMCLQMDSKAVSIANNMKKEISKNYIVYVSFDASATVKTMSGELLDEKLQMFIKITGNNMTCKFPFDRPEAEVKKWIKTYSPCYY